MNIDRLDLNMLRVFDAVYGERNVSKAAERLDLSQASVSHCLTRLRLAFNDQLFARTSKGVEPTAKAKQLAAGVQDALMRLQRALDELDHFDPATSDRTFNLELSDFGEAVAYPLLLEATKSSAPNIRFATTRLNEDNVASALERRQIDLSIGFRHIPGANILNTLLSTEDFVLLAREDHPLLAGAELTVQGMGQAHYVVSELHAAYVMKIMGELDLNQRIQLRCSHSMCIPYVLARTDLATIVPEDLAKTFAQVGGFRIARLPIKTPSFDVRAYWHRRFEGDPGVSWLKQEILRIIARQ